eukprot:jgi/Mesen1/4957/ME000248S04245
MAVMLETSQGEIVVDLFTDECPLTCKNFLKLCKIKYYSNCLFHSVQKDFLVQTGDPTGTGKGGDSIFKFLYGEQARFFDDEIKFYITTRANLDYLDGKHTIFGEVAEGLEALMRINEAYVDDTNRPFKNIRLKHAHVLDDPYPDPPGLADLIPECSPPPRPPAEGEEARLEDDWVPMDTTMDPQELEKSLRSKEAHSRAVVLEMIGDLPEAEVKPPENVLFVCRLNPVTQDDDLEIIFARFGKMDNVLIDDRRIHVDFSQSVGRLWNRFRRIGSKDDNPGAAGEGEEEEARPPPTYELKQSGGQRGNVTKSYGMVFADDDEGGHGDDDANDDDNGNNNGNTFVERDSRGASRDGRGPSREPKEARGGTTRMERGADITQPRPPVRADPGRGERGGERNQSTHRAQVPEREGRQVDTGRHVSSGGGGEDRKGHGGREERRSEKGGGGGGGRDSRDGTRAAEEPDARLKGRDARYEERSRDRERGREQERPRGDGRRDRDGDRDRGGDGDRDRGAGREQQHKRRAAEPDVERDGGRSGGGDDRRPRGVDRNESDDQGRDRAAKHDRHRAPAPVPVPERGRDERGRDRERRHGAAASEAEGRDGRGGGRSVRGRGDRDGDRAHDEGNRVGGKKRDREIDEGGPGSDGRRGERRRREPDDNEEVGRGRRGRRD